MPRPSFLSPCAMSSPDGDWSRIRMAPMHTIHPALDHIHVRPSPNQCGCNSAPMAPALALRTNDTKLRRPLLPVLHLRSLAYYSLVKPHSVFISAVRTVPG